MTLLDAALEYTRHGFRVFPCVPRGKQPLTAHGVKDATADPATVAAWWLTTPDANIGVATGGGRFVLDLDDYEARARLEAAGVALPATTWTSTTGKGAHLWFRGDVGNRTRVVEKVDVRGDGGYVVAPPSVHPNGSEYAWALGSPFDAPILDPPSALMALISPSHSDPAQARSADGTRDWVSTLLAGVDEGGRDDACTRLAGHFLGKGLASQVVASILYDWASRCTPPFPHADVDKCVGSIAMREGEAAPDTLPPGAADVVDKAMALIARPVRVVRKTGLAQLDDLFDGGIEPGTVTLVGARPGVGKTVLLLQMARDMAAEGAGVLVVSLEMSPTRLMRRMLSQTSQVRFENLKTGDLTAGEKAALGMAADALRALPLWIDARVHTVEAIDALLDMYPAGQIGALVIDSIQKLGPPEGNHTQRSAAEHVIKGLTRLAVRRDLPVLAASMLSRPDRADRAWRPQLANLRESAVLEHEADNVLLLHREEGHPKLEAFLRKHRDGEVGDLSLAFDGATLTVRGA